MPVHWTSRTEPSLSEVLADPIVRIVMVRDGVTKEEIDDLIQAVRDKLVGGPAEHPTGER